MESAALSKVSGSSVADHRSDRSIHPAAVAVWLLVQLITLLAAGMDLSIFARPTEAASRYALVWMASMQFAVLSLIFPWLLANVRQSIFILASTLPFIALAGFMAQAAVDSIIATAALFTLWFCGLGIWRSLVCSPTLGAIGICIASSTCVGSAIVTYLLVEFGDMNRDAIIGLRGVLVALLMHVALACIIWVAVRVFAPSYPPASVN